MFSKKKLIKIEIDTITTKEIWIHFFSRDFSWEIKSLLSMNKKNKMGIFKFFTLFSKIWKIKMKQNCFIQIVFSYQLNYCGNHLVQRLNSITKVNLLKGQIFWGNHKRTQ